MEQTLEAWNTLTQLQDEGKVRSIGVSNTYDTRILAALSKVRKVEVVQNRWYEGNNWDQKVFNYCKESGIMYQYVYFLQTIIISLLSSDVLICRSFWTLSGSPSLLAHPALLEIAKTSKLTLPQVVYKLAQLEGVTPLSGTTNETHMREDVDVEDLSFADGISEPLLETLRKFIWE